MGSIVNLLESLEHSAANFNVETFSSILKPEWVKEAASHATEPTERNRKLPGVFVVWLGIALNVYRSLSIQNVLRRLGNGLATASIWRDGEIPSSAATTEARDRLGFEAMKWLLRRFQDWLLATYDDAMRWKGLLLLIIDGSTLKTPDSPANRKDFGLPGTSRGGRSAFPQLRVLFLVSANLRFILRAWFAPYRQNEVGLAMQILNEIPKGSLLLLDRAYLAWWLLWHVHRNGSHFLVRVKRRIRRRRAYKIGSNDWIVRVKLPRALRRMHPQLPVTLEVRELATRIKNRWYHYFTSLADPIQYPAAELVKLYHDRWEVETGLDEMKTHQAELSTVNHSVMFRSREPNRVLQEAFALVIAYNVIRTLMAQAAARHHVEPLRIGFVDALDRIREAIAVMASARTLDLPRIFDALLASMASCLVPLRHRSNRREVCIKMSAYPKKWKKRRA